MLSRARAGMLIWNNVDAAAEDDFNEWYVRQHLFERVSLPGFIRGRRFRAIESSHKYLAIYETDGAAAFSSVEYLDSLNQPGPWTRSVISNFRDWIRSVQVLHDRHGDDGGIVATVRVDASNASLADAASWITTLSPMKLIRPKGMVGATVLKEDAAATDIPSEEKAIGALTTDRAHWTVVLEGSSDRGVRDAVEEVRSSLQKMNATSSFGIYQLISAKYA